MGTGREVRIGVEGGSEVVCLLQGGESSWSEFEEEEAVEERQQVSCRVEHGHEL